MTTLVTGGAGYIGSHTVRALRAAGREVVVLDSLELGTRQAVIDADLIVGDIADRDLITEICRDREIDSAIHFAAYKNVGESMENPAKYFDNNVARSAQLFDTLSANGVDRVVFSSSCSVHGNPPSAPVREDMPIAPESVYAETKAMVEHILGWYGEIRGLRSASLRYFNAAGASFDSQIGENWAFSLNLIPVAIRALLTDDRVLDVFGDDYDTPDGTAIRDYIHVVDLADAHVKALDYLDRGGDSCAVNVGTGTGTSVFGVLSAIERVAGRPVPHRVVGRRAGDPVTIFADPQGARDRMGWESRYGIDEIVSSAYHWHLRQLEQG